MHVFLNLKGGPLRRHVSFEVGVDDPCTSQVARTNRLQRRDTPHHLKNKRIHSNVDKDKVASIIAQVIFIYYL